MCTLPSACTCLAIYPKSTMAMEPTGIRKSRKVVQAQANVGIMVLTQDKYVLHGHLRAPMIRLRVRVRGGCWTDR